MKKFYLIIIAAFALSACSLFYPNSDSPNIVRLAKVCEIRNSAVDAWIEALDADIPTVATAQRVNTYINDTDGCADMNTIIALQSSDNPDALAKEMLWSTSITVASIVSAQLLTTALPEFQAEGQLLADALRSIGISVAGALAPS